MPGWPAKTSKGYDIQAVNRHIRQSANSQPTTKAGQSEFMFAKVDSDMSELKKQEVYERGRKLKLANDLKAGRLIEIKAVEETISRMVAECQSVLDQLPSRLAPQVVGLTIPDAQELLKHEITDAIRRLREGGKNLA